MAAQYVPPHLRNKQANSANSSEPYVDTHCHLDRSMQTANIGNIADFFKANPLGADCDAVFSVFCDPATYLDSSMAWKDIVGQEKVFGIFGIHPHNAKDYTDDVERGILEAHKHAKAIAYGECGLDYHYDNSPRELQQQVFIRQIKLGLEMKKPIVIHSREAEEDMLAITEQHIPSDWPIHLHCCSGSEPYVTRMLSHFPNLYVGFTGAITFKSATSQRKLIKDVIPLERLLLETDGPYMKPVPPGKGISICSDIPAVAAVIAKEKGVPVSVVLQQCRVNTRNLYGV